MSTILVVDDDPATVQLVTSLLEQAGHRAIGRTDPDGIEQILGRDRVDVVVLDMVMPGISGIDVISALRTSRRGNTVPILILSGRTRTDLKVESLRAGADDYLTKPFDGEELVARIERLAERANSHVALAGQLRRFPIADLLQSLAQGHQSGVLSVDGGPEIAHLELRDGLIRSAAAGGLRGEDALLWLADWTDGFFSFEDGFVDAEPAADAPELRIGPVLLEAVWLVDEIEKHRAQLPVLNQVLERGSATVPDPTAENRKLPLEAVVSALEERPACTLRDLLQLDLAAPNRVRLAVIDLLRTGAVQLREQRPTAGSGRAPAPAVRDDATVFDDLRAVLEKAGAESGNSFVLVHAAPGARSDLATFASSLPWGMTSARSERFFEQLTSRGSGLLRFRDRHGQTVLSFRMLTSVPTAGQRALVSLAHAVVLWLGDGEEDLVLVESYAPILDRGRSRTLGLVIAPDHRHADVGKHLDAHPCWQLAASVPSRLPTLVQLLHAHHGD